jgi:ABC-2 type transport system permease protein
MRLSKSWAVASKDFKVFRKKKLVIYLMVVFPLLFSFLLPAVIVVAKTSKAEISILLPAFTFLYLVLAGVIPTTIASYSIVGEKVEKSLEPLLATPTTDSEILFGKVISAFLPSITGILGGFAIFMFLMDLVTRARLGYYFFPNLNSDLVFFLMVPLAVIMSVEWNVFVSSRASDVRVAQQVGGLLMAPFVGIYVAGELNLIGLGVTNNLLYICAALAVADVILFTLARATFRREEILTKWK